MNNLERPMTPHEVRTWLDFQNAIRLSQKSPDQQQRDAIAMGFMRADLQARALQQIETAENRSQ